MTIDLPEGVERSIRAAIQDGRFTSADEAVIAAWRVYEQSAEPVTGRADVGLADFHRQLLLDGVISQLPDPSQDGDDIEPVVIEGEPLSETIIRERI